MLHARRVLRKSVTTKPNQPLHSTTHTGCHACYQCDRSYKKHSTIIWYNYHNCCHGAIVFMCTRTTILATRTNQPTLLFYRNCCLLPCNECNHSHNKEPTNHFLPPHLLRSSPAGVAAPASPEMMGTLPPPEERGVRATKGGKTTNKNYTAVLT